MRTKFSLFTLALAFVASFSSCNNDNDTDGTGVDGGKKTTMSISIPQVKTYADANATPTEINFVTADVFVYSGGALITHETFSATDFTTPDPITGARKLTTPLETTTGAKRIFVGLNISAALRSQILAGGPSAAASVTAADLSSSSNGFAMFNKNVASNVNFNVQSDATLNNFEIAVERLVAKTTVRKADALNYEATNIKVTNLAFCMGNVNTKTFPLQDVNVVSGVVKDPNWSFVGAPNFLGTPPNPAYKVDFVNEFGTNASINAAAYVPVDVESATLASRKVKYVVENTSERFFQGEVTFASIRANFYPTKLATWDGTDLTLNDNSDVVASMWAVSTPAGEFAYFTTEAMANSYAAYLIAEAGGNTSAATVSNEYKNGLCYYYNWLDAKDGKNTVATLRNIYYDMKITKINSIGYPNPEPNPNPPVPTKAELTVEVSIVPWTLVTSDESLGQI